MGCWSWRPCMTTPACRLSWLFSTELKSLALMLPDPERKVTWGAQFDLQGASNGCSSHMFKQSIMGFLNKIYTSPHMQCVHM